MNHTINEYHQMQCNALDEPLFMTYVPLWVQSVVVNTRFRVVSSSFPNSNAMISTLLLALQPFFCTCHTHTAHNTNVELIDYDWWLVTDDWLLIMKGTSRFSCWQVFNSSDNWVVSRSSSSKVSTQTLFSSFKNNSNSSFSFLARSNAADIDVRWVDVFWVACFVVLVWWYMLYCVIIIGEGVFGCNLNWLIIEERAERAEIKPFRLLFPWL